MSIQSSALYELLEKHKKNKRVAMHSFHRYYGKLIPAIPAAAIELYARKGEAILDPFAGSGTTLIEAVTAGYDAFGIEINPISADIIRVKTAPVENEIILKGAALMEEFVNGDTISVSPDEIPFCVHMDHWFRPEVQRSLVMLKKAADRMQVEIKAMYGETAAEQMQLFMQMTISAMIRIVSNADPLHVFPGYSKRLKALDLDGARHIDVNGAFFKALKKRVRYALEFNAVDNKGTAHVFTGDAAEWRPEIPPVGLIITNPPYISSVRYIETMKLEMYWLEYIFSKQDYTELEKRMIGYDKISRKKINEEKIVGISEIDEVIGEIALLDKLRAHMVAEYFIRMKTAVAHMCRYLKRGGHVVLKISDSKVRKISVHTGKLLSIIAEKKGFAVEDLFTDHIHKRSFTSARNSYSDIILHDYIITWRKL